MSFGERITELRTEKDLSRKELATILDIGYQSLSKYETDERIPDKDTITKIAEYFEVSTDYLLERTNIRRFEAGGSAFNINVAELDDEDIEFVKAMVERLKSKHSNKLK